MRCWKWLKIRKRTRCVCLIVQKLNTMFIAFEVPEEHLSGVEVAELIQANVKTVFKTLVLENTKHEHFVFVIPVSETLDMKKAAALVGEKKLQLMPLDNLKNVTGHIRGGCSPVGMKTLFPTVVDKSCENYSHISVSGGSNNANHNSR